MGLDIAKSVFQVHGVDTAGEVVICRQLKRRYGLAFFQKLPSCVLLREKQTSSPTGYSFNLDGTCLYLATAAVFLAQATNTPLDIWYQVGLLLILLVTSKGAAGVAGAAFVVLAATLGAESSIPVASVALILGIHRLMSQGLTPTNYLGNAIATIVMAKWEGALDEARMHRLLDEGELERDLGSIAPASP
jgi:hypothetical protein